MVKRTWQYVPPRLSIGLLMNIIVLLSTHRAGGRVMVDKKQGTLTLKASDGFARGLRKEAPGALR